MTSSAQAGDTQSLSLQIRKVKIYEGIEILLIPKDENGILTEIEGNVTVRLWFYYRTEDSSDITSDDRLVCDWGQVPLSREAYSPFLGAILFFPYDSFYLFKDTYGVMRVMLETADGMKLYAEKDAIKISKEYACC